MKDIVQEKQPSLTTPAAQREAQGQGGQLATELASSPRQLAQRRLIGQAMGRPVQRVEGELDEEEGSAAQLRSEPAQREVGELDKEEEPPAAAQLRAEPAQRPENRTGMPDGLKSGIESLSGMNMSDVRVHRNSSQPAQLNALAYAQGNDIHLGPGQEQHLPHEAWHVVQQRQGRVQATTQMAGLGVNDDEALEKEADSMGDKAMQLRAGAEQQAKSIPAQAMPRGAGQAQRKKAFRGTAAANQPAWDALWLQIGSYFDDSVKGWFDIGAKTGLAVPKATEFGHGSKKRNGGGSVRAMSRFATLQGEIWRAARMDTDMPSKKALAQLKSAHGVPVADAVALVQQQPAMQTVQLLRLTRVVGGMEIDLDTIDDDALLRTYRHYWLPNHDHANYRQFGEDIRAELSRRQLAVPTHDSETEWVCNRALKRKYGLLLGYFYRPVSPHNRAGVTHYPDYTGQPNTRANHVKMTEAGVRLMDHALAMINASKATFVSAHETFTNVCVKVNGVFWGLHLGDERQIYPIEGQGLPDYFES